MPTVTYEATTRRLRIGGACPEDVNRTVQRALQTAAQAAGRHLIVDLTAVTDLDQRVADDLVAAAARWTSAGSTITFVRKHRTPVDDALVAAEARHSGVGTT